MFLITFEGLDCSGKTTQAIALTAHLKLVYGDKVVRTAQPGGTRISNKIREILLDKENSDMDNVAEFLLFAAARAQHVREVVKPALNEGKIVVCSRWKDSMVAYTGARNLIANTLPVSYTYDLVFDGLVPDLTFNLDLPASVAIERLKNRGELDRIEMLGEEYLASVRRKYIGIEKYDGSWETRGHWVNANRPTGKVFRDVVDIVEKFLDDKLGMRHDA